MFGSFRSGPSKCENLALSLNDLKAGGDLPVDAANYRGITELADVIQQCGPLGTGKFVEPRQPFCLLQ